MNDPVRILLVDAQDAFRQALQAHLEQAGNLTLVGVVWNEQMVCEQLDGLKPDVVLLSLDAPHSDGAPGNAPLVARINARYPHTKVLVLGAGDDQETLALDTFRHGAQGYLNKETASMREIVAAIYTLDRGGAIVDARMTGWILNEIAAMRRQKAPT